MPQEPSQRPFFLRLQLRLAQARFFSFSLLVHIVLVVIGGSIVLIKTQAPQVDFVAGDGQILTEVSTNEPPQPKMEQPQEMKLPEPSNTATSPLPVDAIASSATTSASFHMASAPIASAASLTSAIDKGIASKIATVGSGAGMKGGTTKMLGQKEKISNALVGTFYDLKQTRARKPTAVTPDEYHKIFRKYIAENWKESILTEYFHPKDLIYATQIFTPNIPAEEGPKAFGLEKVVQPSRWMVHYRGKVSPPDDGVYHFVGAGDDVMLVRFNGKLVLDRCWYQEDEQLPPEQNYDYGWSGIPHGFGKGSAFQAKAGQFYDIDVLIGEQPGGFSYAALLIEQEGAAYQRDAKGNPILPVFRLADGPLAEPEPGTAYAPHQADGPVWKATAIDSGHGDSTFDQFFGQKN